jgi:hypothetical protein
MSASDSDTSPAASSIFGPGSGFSETDWAVVPDSDDFGVRASDDEHQQPGRSHCISSR